VGSVTYFELLLRSPWPRLVVLALILAAVGYSVFLYRQEVSLTLRRRVLLGVLRGLLLALVVVVLFEPILGLEMTAKVRRTLLVLLDTSESMSTRDPRRTEDEVKDAALALGKIKYEEAGSPLSEKVRAESAAAPRFDLAKGLLENPTENVFEKLRKDYTVRYFGFGEDLKPAEGKGETAVDALAGLKPDGKATRLGTALQDAVDRNAGQNIAGIVILTDGISNDGLEPLAVAQRMGQRNVPIYPVGIGLPRAPDVELRTLIAPDAVFHKDRVPVRVEVVSNGYANRAATLSILMDGQEVATKAINLNGRSQFEEVVFLPEAKGGAAKLEVAIPTLPGEMNAANNRLSKTLRVIPDTIKVLYVEGKPRWEYRYLRQVLLRDPRLDVKFLLTEGDRDQAQSSEMYLTDFPEDAAKAFKFDLIILGDVPASYFSHAQLARIEELVQKHGGSFLMLAGQQNAPATYVGTPIASLLPVRVRAEGWQDVDDSVTPVLAEGAADNVVMTLDSPKERNAELWAQVHPLFKLPALEGAKPAASVLATISRGSSRGEPYPLIAWQRYGSGKSLFVGSDQIWRLRFKQGDKYHARFWGQAIQFLTLSRLLGESKRIQLETDRQDYRLGQRVQVSANVLDENYQPVKAAAYTIYLDRTIPTKHSAAVRLEPVPNIPGLYQGFVSPDQPGKYSVRIQGTDVAVANTTDFTVVAANLEELERSEQEELLKNMAEVSGGKCFAIRDVPKLADTIAGEQRTTVIRRERELWDLPFVFVAILALAGVEWFLRRRYDLV